MLFSELDISLPLLKALKKYKYLQPTSVQKKVIPLLGTKINMIVKAQTGSGKTASFILPILEEYVVNPILKRSKKNMIQTLILVPTRELALQITQTLDIFSTYLPYPPRYTQIISGEEIGRQLLYIQKGCDIIVVTSGRLLDIIDKKQINLCFVKRFIIDEADKMIDIGFKEQLETILNLLPKDRQNLLFSATYPPKVLEIADIISPNYTKLFIEDKYDKPDIVQKVIYVNKEKRNPLLQFLCKKYNWKKVLVFQSSKKATDNISVKFRKYGFKADSIHGDLLQEDRTYTLNQFKNGKLNILFSTDLTSRGIDIQNVDCVINYDLPRGSDDYIHRIGRTGRAGKSGIAISFVNYDNEDHFKLILKRTKANIHIEHIDGFELLGTPNIKQKGTMAIKGKRKSKKDKLREQQNKSNN